MAIAALLADRASAAESTAPHRFQLSGSGRLSFDSPAQQNDALRLRAIFSAATRPDGPAMQSDARFALSATLAVATVVCYADTIYRDDFDGDGF